MVNNSNHRREPQLRCIGDLFGYCSGKPKPITETIISTYKDFGGRTYEVKDTQLRCENEPTKCPHFLTQTALIERQLNRAQLVDSP